MSTKQTRYGSPQLSRAATGDRRIWFRLVTRDVDRHGTIIEPAGVRLDAFKANPVFLWMHDSGGGEVTPPPDVVIGRVVSFDQSREFLDIEVEFDDDGADGMASTCFRKVKEGFIRMVSIGCNVVVEDEVEVDGHHVPVYAVTELLECSLVIVGSNRRALKLDRAAAAAMLRSAYAVPRVKRGDQVATCAVFNSKKEMLWGKRRDSGKYTTPGGHMLPTESPSEGAKRELMEEAGIEVEHLDYIGVVEVGDIFVHVVKVDGCDQTPNSSNDPDNEVETWEWIPLEDGALPARVTESLHSVKNAHIELGVCRAVMGGEAVSTILSDSVITDALTEALPRGAEFVSGVTALGFDTEGSSEGLVVKSAPVTASRGVVPHKKFPLVEGAWDADAAVARWRRYSTAADGSIDWSKFAECFAWFDSDKPDAVGSYKLPHHDIRDGKPVTVWGGVVTAAAAIQGARGGVKGIPAADVAKIEQHLGEHYREFDKVPPWDTERAVTYMPEPIVPAVATIADGPLFPLAGAVPPTVQALVFSSGRFSQAAAQQWCGDNGFAISTTVSEVGSGFSHCGIVVTENSLLVEQLPEACFTGGFVTFVLEEGVSAICGTLNEWGQNSLRRSVTDIDFAASKGAIAELKLGLDWHEQGLSGDGLELMTVREARRITSTGKWWPEKVKRAFAFFARHDEQAGPLRDDKGKPTPKAVARALWGGDAGKKDATKLRNAMVAAEKRAAFAAAWTAPDAPAFAALIATSLRSHNSTHYLVRSDNHIAEPTKRSVAAKPTETKQMKRSPECRAAYRALIHHALEGAEMHTRAMEDGHVADEHRTIHHAMAMRALDHADEMNAISRAAFIGNTASQDVVVDGAIESGEIFNVPASRNAELQARFTEVATKCGKLPRSLRSVVAAELGTEDSELVGDKLMGFKLDRTSLIDLRRASVESSKKVDRAETEQAIEQALNEKLIAPADAKRMRGLDPATGAVKGEPWTRTRVERFVSERREVGPIAEVVRPGVERTVQSQVERTVAAPSAVPIRYGHAQQQLSQQDATILARKISQNLGLKDGELDNHMAAAAALPATDVKAALANSKAM